MSSPLMLEDLPWFSLLFFLMMIVYTPLGLYQLYLVISAFLHSDEEEILSQHPLAIPNRVLVVITTNGLATDVVEKIIAKVQGYGVAAGVFVVKEAKDPFHYSCTEITVPADYRCAHGSRCKMRAMQYGIEWLHAQGYGQETYICHLDDDSIVDRPYLMYVKYYLTAAGAQGCIRLRAFGRHLFSSLSDIVRIANCEAWCRHGNRRNDPQFVHGEGIVIRADVEYEIGWDYGTYGAEDLIMGLNISRRHEFAYIPFGNIYIAPPTTVRDFYKHRRRWFWSVLKDHGQIRALSRKTKFFYNYMYVNGVLGVISLLLFPFILVFVNGLTPLLIALAIVNFVCFISYYQFGAMQMHSAAISALMLLLQIPVAFYDGLTTVYSLATRPDFTTFETIKKV